MGKNEAAQGKDALRKLCGFAHPRSPISPENKSSTTMALDLGWDFWWVVQGPKKGDFTWIQAI